MQSSLLRRGAQIAASVAGLAALALGALPAGGWTASRPEREREHDHEESGARENGELEAALTSHGRIPTCRVAPQLSERGSAPQLSECGSAPQLSGRQPRISTRSG